MKRLCRIAGLVLLPLMVLPVGLAASTRQAPPVKMTAQQAHARMMKLLHISALRPGADPNHPNAPNAVNYDESKANPYPHLPDPLLLNDGRKVTTAAEWWNERRPEIVRDFNLDVYGRVPETTPSVKWEVTSRERATVGDIPVIRKELVGHVDNSAYPFIKVNIRLTLTTPANARGPVPVMLQLGLDPVFMKKLLAMLAAHHIKLPPPPPGPPWQQRILAKGWGYALYFPTDVQPDSGAGLTEGIIGLCNHGQPRRPDQWGALRAWAWGASRVLDYFQTDPSVDARQVGLEGHSRYGKAALIAMAYDRRFAIAYVSSSGMGGANLYRRNYGERLENLAGTGEFHWMAGNFLKYAGPLTPNDLPVDSHELIAMCAPRPVFISAGTTKHGDGWVDARGMFMAEAAAGPVYDLLGAKGLGTSKFPPTGTALLSGDLAFRQHHDGHSDLPNWPVFLKFASRYFKALPPASKPAGGKPPRESKRAHGAD